MESTQGRTRETSLMLIEYWSLQSISPGEDVIRLARIVALKMIVKAGDSEGTITVIESLSHAGRYTTAWHMRASFICVC